MDLVAGAAVEFEIAHRCGDIGLALPNRLAGIARFQCGKFRTVRLDEKEKPRQATSALDCRHPDPRSFIEGSPGRPDGAIDIRLAGSGYRCKYLAIGRRRHIDPKPGHGIDRLAIDELHERQTLGDRTRKMRSHSVCLLGVRRHRSYACMHERHSTNAPFTPGVKALPLTQGL